MWKGAGSELFKRAEKLRERMTKAEVRLWEELENSQLDGYKFRRQHPIHKFIVDFYCHKLKLIIEVDGKYHESDEQKNSDLERNELLTFQGIQIIRFTNEEVLNNIDHVLKRVRKKIEIIDLKK